LKKILRLHGVILALALLCAADAFAQTNYQATFSQTAYSAQTTAAPTTQFRNVGQSSQWLYYQVGGTTTAINIELEGAYDPINGPWTALSGVGTSLTTGMVCANTWMPFLRANILTLTGAAPSVNAQYSASTSTGGCSAQGGLAGSGASSSPVTFVPSTTITGTATNSSPIVIAAAGTPVVLFGCTVNNAVASTVFLVITSTSPVSTSSTYVLPIAASSPGQCALPTIGVNIPTSAGSTRAFCTTSLSSPADPGTACQVTIIFKQGVLVNGNVSVSGTQQGNQQGGGPNY
jgi:hypothetical protein